MSYLTFMITYLKAYFVIRSVIGNKIYPLKSL